MSLASLLSSHWHTIATGCGAVIGLISLRLNWLNSQKTKAELDRIRREFETGERRIVIPTPEQVERYSRSSTRALKTASSVFLLLIGISFFATRSLDDTASDQEVAELKTRIKEMEPLRPTILSFNEFVDQIEENSGHDPSKIKEAYTALLNDEDVKASGVPASLNPDANEINAFLRGKAAQKPTDEQKKAILAAARQLALPAEAPKYHAVIRVNGLSVAEKSRGSVYWRSKESYDSPEQATQGAIAEMKRHISINQPLLTTGFISYTAGSEKVPDKK